MSYTRNMSTNAVQAQLVALQRQGLSQAQATQAITSQVRRRQHEAYVITKQQRKPQG